MGHFEQIISRCPLRMRKRIPPRLALLKLSVSSVSASRSAITAPAWIVLVTSAAAYRSAEALKEYAWRVVCPSTAPLRGVPGVSACGWRQRRARLHADQELSGGGIRAAHLNRIRAGTGEVGRRPGRCFGCRGWPCRAPRFRRIEHAKSRRKPRCHRQHQDVHALWRTDFDGIERRTAGVGDAARFILAERDRRGSGLRADGHCAQQKQPDQTPKERLTKARDCDLSIA